MDLKTVAIVLGVAALAATGYVIFLHRGNRIAPMGPPALLPAPTRAESKANLAQNDLAKLQVLKGAKAVAEASKEAQLGNVRAHDRAAEKAKVAA